MWRRQYTFPSLINETFGFQLFSLLLYQKYRRQWSANDKDHWTKKIWYFIFDQILFFDQVCWFKILKFFICRINSRIRVHNNFGQEFHKLSLLRLKTWYKAFHAEKSWLFQSRSIGEPRITVSWKHLNFELQSFEWNERSKISIRNNFVKIEFFRKKVYKLYYWKPTRRRLNSALKINKWKEQPRNSHGQTLIIFMGLKGSKVSSS